MKGRRMAWSANPAKSWYPVEESCLSVLEHPPGNCSDVIAEVEHVGTARNKIAARTAARLIGDEGFEVSGIALTRMVCPFHLDRDELMIRLHDKIDFCAIGCAIIKKRARSGIGKCAPELPCDPMLKETTWIHVDA